jgi:formamidopyrimidine-DNA glycosylase
MPEGPECRRIAESLAQFASNKKIIGIEILSGRYSKKIPSGFDTIKENLPVYVAGAGVHGKFVYLILNKEFSIWNTLGMTGAWSTMEHSHNRLKIIFADGTCLYFRDQRNFGTLKFVRGKHQLIEKLRSLGPDMLNVEIPDKEFIARLRKKNKQNVCKVLMDQSVVCGIGNYIKADSLWKAKINPHSKVSDLSDQCLKDLNKSIQEILRASHASGWWDISSGSWKKEENTSKFLVYNMKVDPKGNEIIKEQTPDGRTTHWSPKYQKGGIS